MHTKIQKLFAFTVLMMFAISCRARKTQIAEPVVEQSFEASAEVKSFGDIDLRLEASDEEIQSLAAEQIQEEVIQQVQGEDKTAPTAMMAFQYKNKPTGTSLKVGTSYDVSPSKNTFDPSSSKCKKNSGIMGEFYRVSPLPRRKHKLGNWQQMDRFNCERMGLPYKFDNRGYYHVEMKVVDASGLESHASGTYSVSKGRRNSVPLGFHLSASKLLLEPNEVAELKPLDCPKYGKVFWSKVVKDKETKIGNNNIGVNVFGESQGNVYVKATCSLPGNVNFYASLTLAVE